MKTSRTQCWLLDVQNVKRHSVWEYKIILTFWQEPSALRDVWITFSDRYLELKFVSPRKSDAFQLLKTTEKKIGISCENEINVIRTNL